MRGINHTNRMSEQDQDIVTTTTNDEPEIEINLDDTEDVEVLRETVQKAQEAQRQILARAKKAEAELKSLKEKPQPQNTQALSVEDIQTEILKSKGIDSELLAEMKTLAKLRNKSVLEIENDPIFVAMKEEKEKKAKEEKSKLGSPRGSATVKPKKDFNTPGLTEEEHREMVNNLFR
jgi:hypothetical protein